MNLGRGGCSEPRLHHCIPAWAKKSKILSQKQTNEKQKDKRTKQIPQPKKMASKDMKLYSASHVVRRLQMKILMRYHYRPIQRIKILNTGEDVEQRELLFTAGGKTKWYSHCGRQFGSLLQNEKYSYHLIQYSCSLVFTQMS